MDSRRVRNLAGSRLREATGRRSYPLVQAPTAFRENTVKSLIRPLRAIVSCHLGRAPPAVWLRPPSAQQTPWLFAAKTRRMLNKRRGDDQYPREARCNEAVRIRLPAHCLPTVPLALGACPLGSLSPLAPSSPANWLYPPLRGSFLESRWLAACRRCFARQTGGGTSCAPRTRSGPPREPAASRHSRRPCPDTNDGRRRMPPL